MPVSPAQNAILALVVSADGVSPDSEKTMKVKDWPPSMSTKETQQFHQNFATILKPLHKLTEQLFKWNEY